MPPKGIGHWVSCSQYSPRSIILCNPFSAYVNLFSWIITPQSTNPLLTAFSIEENTIKFFFFALGKAIANKRCAVVLTPGIATVQSCILSRGIGLFETNNGPTPLPKAPPASNTL